MPIFNLSDNYYKSVAKKLVKKVMDDVDNDNVKNKYSADLGSLERKDCFDSMHRLSKELNELINGYDLVMRHWVDYEGDRSCYAELVIKPTQ